MRYRDLSLSHGLQVLIFHLVAARQPFGVRLFLLRIFSAFHQRKGGFPLSRFCLRTLTYVKIENVRKSRILRA